MKNRRFSAFIVSFLAAVLVSFAASCDDNETETGGSSVGGQGLGGSGNGGSTELSPWVQGEPGTPGAPLRLGKGMPFAQGLTARQKVAAKGFKTMADEHCLGGGLGGAGGAGGTPDVGDAGGSDVPSMSYCPSSYAPADPTLDLSQITLTDFKMVVAAQPVLQPVEDPVTQEACTMANQPISFGGLYAGDCTGALQPMDVFTQDDISSFFGLTSSLLPANTHLTMNGGPVTLISGSAIRTAAIEDTTYVVSNVSSTLIKVDPDPMTPGAFIRTDLDLGSKGVSGLMALPDGRLVFSTLRTFTVDSWNGSMNDPSLLVEAAPIVIKIFDPATQTVTDLSTISGGTKVKGQNGTPATLDQDGVATSYFIAGSANVLTLSQDGNILFSDRLDGKVFKIAITDGTTTELFAVPSDVLLSGLTEAPNGIIYVVKSASADFNCSAMVTKPIISYWDAGTLSLVDWDTLDDPEYDAILPAICQTGVVERSGMMDRTFLGGGLFVDMIHDSFGNLIVTASVTGVTQAIPVVPPPDPGGDGGAGGSGGSSP
jgi:hypothetical protein